MLFFVYVFRFVYLDLFKIYVFMIFDSLYIIFFFINYMYFLIMFFYVKVFEKVFDELKYSFMYVQLCLRFSEEVLNFDDFGKIGNSVSIILKVIIK